MRKKSGQICAAISMFVPNLSIIWLSLMPPFAKHIRQPSLIHLRRQDSPPPGKSKGYTKARHENRYI